MKSCCLIWQRANCIRWCYSKWLLSTSQTDIHQLYWLIPLKTLLEIKLLIHSTAKWLRKMGHSIKLWRWWWWVSDWKTAKLALKKNRTSLVVKWPQMPFATHHQRLWKRNLFTQIILWRYFFSFSLLQRQVNAVHWSVEYFRKPIRRNCSL